MNAPRELPPIQAAQLAVLRDSLAGIELSDQEVTSLVWLAGFPPETVQRIAALITRARQHPLPEKKRGTR